MISSKIRRTVDKIVCLSTNQKTPNRTTFNIISSISIKLYDKTHRLIKKQNIVQYEIVANKRTGIVMYADAGDWNRAYWVTFQDDPTTPQRHTFTNDGISTIYKQKQIGHFRKKKVSRMRSQWVRLTYQLQYNFEGLSSALNDAFPECVWLCVDTGDRNRVYRMGARHDPTTPQRHTFKKVGIKTIYEAKNSFSLQPTQKIFCHEIMSFLTIYSTIRWRNVKSKLITRILTERLREF